MTAPEKTILAVDDENDIIEMLVMLLESEGYRVLTATGGEAAFEILENERPDLVLLDIMMPHVDGHQVCRHIRSRGEFAGTPVLMLTAKNDIDHIAQALDEGADGFIVKPFDVDQFLRIIEFRVAGSTAEFYRQDEPVMTADGMTEEQLADSARIVFLDLQEPEADFSAVVHACEDLSHCLMSLWQEEIEEGINQTTALLAIESSSQFGAILNRMLDAPDVQISNCNIFKEFADIPADIMHGGNR